MAANLVSRLAPAASWKDIGAPEHCVQFFERDSHLIESLGCFIGAGLETGCGAVVICTPEHERALIGALSERGLDVETAIAVASWPSWR